MDKQALDVFLENQSLKFEFTLRNLDLSQVFWETPDNLERENRFLRHLLDWVQKYSEYKSRSRMELEGYDYPPMEPDISPEDDWYRFERWMQGKPLQQKLKTHLPKGFTPKNPEHLTDDEIISELEDLYAQLIELRVSVDIIEHVPPRLVYENLLEMLEEDFDIITEGFWHLDGCSGCCPDCFQRPWCDMGTTLCWLEDEQAGEMVLIDSVKRYVSASPISFILLQKSQAEEDRRFAEFQQSRENHTIQITPPPFNFDDFNFDDDDELPF